MLRPLPDLDNAQAMTKLGRLSALRNARADALHELRDCVVRLQSPNGDFSVEAPIIETCIQRLKEIECLQAQIE